VSFRAEPYGVFVDDLVSAITGGTTRERFRFLLDQGAYELEAGDQSLAATVRVHGLHDDTHTRFRNGIDFTADGGAVVWLAPPVAVPPDEGSWFYASYERVPDPQRPPRLTDRNPGSVLRTLAESFAREYAVLSRQLEQVYDGAFVATAEGRDLDQVAALVGVERRTQLFAVGEVVFSRTTPAPGDILIEEGTRISSSDVPPVTVATTEARRLRTGNLSVAVPVQAEVSGAAGVAPANRLVVIHRPILGITRVTNPEPLAFRGGTETDAALRRRVARALEGAGRSTPGAIVSALLAVDGIREQDVAVQEDHVAFPGVVKVIVAADLDETRRRQAAALIDDVRPAGIRILHNLDVPPPPAPPLSPGGGATPGPPAAPGLVDGAFWPVDVVAAVTPGAADLPAADREALVADVEAAIDAAIEAGGVGQQVVYNQVVAAVMAVAGVYDVVADLFPSGTTPAGRQNLTPPPGTRPRRGSLDVTLRGALIALDITIAVERKGLAASTDAAQALDAVRTDVIARLNAVLPTLASAITPSTLLGALTDTDTYSVDELGYVAEFLDEGLRILSPNREIQPSADQVPWVRTVIVTDSEIVS
jgi:uncharacterized phage protein gp47/JayE